MNKIAKIVLAAGILGTFLYTSAFAQTTNTSTAQELAEKIVQLKAQITQLQAQLEAVRSTVKEIKTTLGLIRQLRLGMNGDDVKLLQQILATDPEIYPEGLITGHFGSLTAKAVRRLQKSANLDQVGLVGPRTLAKINALLKEGAGESGKVPPGLLIAPGIRKKLGDVTFGPFPGQILPPGIEKKLETATPSDDGVTRSVNGVRFWDWE